MSPPFKKLPTSKKGSFGEQIVKNFLKENGCTIYSSDDKEEGHPIDFIVVRGTEIVAVDVKTKPRREYYQDTGFDLKDFDKYTELQNINKIKVVIYFVDEREKKVYVALLSNLSRKIKVGEKNYPFIEGAGREKVIYFPLQNMKIIRSLTDLECLAIAEYSSRNKGYD